MFYSCHLSILVLTLFSRVLYSVKECESNTSNGGCPVRSLAHSGVDRFCFSLVESVFFFSFSFLLRCVFLLTLDRNTSKPIFYSKVTTECTYISEFAF